MITLAWIIIISNFYFSFFMVSSSHLLPIAPAKPFLFINGHLAMSKVNCQCQCHWSLCFFHLLQLGDWFSNQRKLGSNIIRKQWKRQSHRPLPLDVRHAPSTGVNFVSEFFQSRWLIRMLLAKNFHHTWKPGWHLINPY